MLFAEIQSYGFPKHAEDELLSQLSNGQKKMCEDKLRTFIRSTLFDKLVEKQLPSYLKAAQEEPSKKSVASEDIVHKLRNVSSLLKGAAKPQHHGCALQSEAIASFENSPPTGSHQSPSMAPLDLVAPQRVIQEPQNTNSEELFEEAHASVSPSAHRLQVKNTSIDGCDELQESDILTLKVWISG
jgi:hypothetical protein